MRRMILLTLILSSGCVLAPVVDDCTIDALVSGSHCASTDGDVSKSHDLTYDQMDKYVCRSLADFNVRENYRRDVEKKLAQCQSSSGGN